MNDKLAALFARRSVRKYTDEQVSNEMVQHLLEAAMAAPSACAKDPWRFVVVRDRSRLAAIAAGLPNGPMLSNAAVGIVVCGDMDVAHGNLESYMLQDCSAAIENLLLAVSMLGLGACWLGVHPKEDRMTLLTEILDLPPTIVPVCAVAIGHPTDTPAPRTRFNNDYVHQEKW